jgi:hypothetical protein
MHESMVQGLSSPHSSSAMQHPTTGEFVQAQVSSSQESVVHGSESMQSASLTQHPSIRVKRHWPVEVSHPLSRHGVVEEQSPQLPPQPSGPHCLLPHRGEQTSVASEAEEISKMESHRLSASSGGSADSALVLESRIGNSSHLSVLISGRGLVPASSVSSIHTAGSRPQETVMAAARATARMGKEANARVPSRRRCCKELLHVVLVAISAAPCSRSAKATTLLGRTLNMLAVTGDHKCKRQNAKCKVQSGQASWLSATIDHRPSTITYVP